MPALKPYWGKPAVRNFRGDDGNGGIIRSPQRAIVLPDSGGARGNLRSYRDKESFRGPTLSHVWKATRMGATSQAPICPDVVGDPGMCRRSLSLGTGRARVQPL